LLFNIAVLMTSTEGLSKIQRKIAYTSKLLEDKAIHQIPTVTWIYLVNKP